jgi:hypothetical protein
MTIDIAECSLAELIDDPLIGRLMKSDAVDRRNLEALLERVAREWERATKGAEVIVSLPRLPTSEGARC